ncbi:MAG: hypothetical protein ABI587_10430 [Gemmatimonadales bacterium]
MPLTRPLSSVALLLAFSFVGPAAAQFTATQDVSLKGLSLLDRQFTSTVAYLSPDSVAALRDDADLRLRQAGLRLLTSAADSSRPEGLLRISLTSSSAGRWTEDLVVRIQVEQTAVLARTDTPMLMVTWYAEETSREVPSTESVAAIRALLERGVTRFMRAWMAAQGR